MQLPRGRIQLMRIFGIRVGVSTSWFVVLFLAIYFLEGNFHAALGGSALQAYEAGVASALLFFASLLLHELAHALVARRQGIAIDGIDLWLLGGVAKMRSAPETPGGEFAIAVSGPLVNLALAVLFTAIGLSATNSHDLLQVALLATGAHASPLVAVAGWVALINVLIFVFNLVPAFPLDGGQIAHAIAWRISGQRNAAMRVAAQLGRAFGYLLCGLGLLAVAANDGLTLLGISFAVIGYTIANSARAQLLQSRVHDRMRAIRIADIMDAHPVTIPGETQLLEARDAYFARYGWPWFAVVDGVGRFLGLLQLAQVEDELRRGRPALPASEVVEGGGSWQVDPSATLDAALGTEAMRRLGAVVAVDSEGLVRGVVTLAQVRRALASGAAL